MLIGAPGAASPPWPLGGDGTPTPTISHESLALRQGVQEFIHSEVLPRADRLEAGELSLLPGLIGLAGAAGIPGATLPEECGGLGLGVLDGLLVAHGLAGCPAFATALGAHAGLAGTAIALGGNAAQRARWLPGIADGSTPACYGLTEPNAGSDALALRTTATRDGEDWVLSGSKQFITNAGFAELAVVFALADGTAFSAFVVPMDAAGITLGPEERKLGLHGSSTRALHLDGVRVPADHLLGTAGRGHRTAFAVLTIGRLRLAAGALGEVRHLLGIIGAHCREREQFGQPLAEFALTQAKVGAITADLLAAEAAVWSCGARLDAELRAIPEAAYARRAPIRITGLDVEAALCKVLASELLGRTADEAVQLFGGYGYMEDSPVARAFRDARVQRIYEGTNEICRLLVAPGLGRRTLPEPPLDADTFLVSCTHALTALLRECLVHVDDDDQIGAVRIADLAAHSLRLDRLAVAPSSPGRAMARHVVARDALEQSAVFAARLLDPDSRVLTRTHALIARMSDADRLTRSIGKRVLGGREIAL